MWPARIPLLSTILLFATGLILTARLVYYEPQIVSPQPAFAQADAAAPEPDAGAQTTIQLAGYGETTARPLFSVDRRPIVIPEVAPVAAQTVVAVAPDPLPPTADHIYFSGSMIRGGHASAYLEGPSGSEWVQLNDSFDGWKVVNISENSIVMKKGDSLETKFLYTAQK